MAGSRIFLQECIVGVLPGGSGAKRLCVPNAGGSGSVAGQGTRSHVPLKWFACRN